MQQDTPSAVQSGISLYDARPFFEKALRYGLAHGVFGQEKIDAMRNDAPKGMVQIARYFGNEFLRPDIEKARDRLVNLVSLCLEHSCGGDLQQAAESLRDHSFLSRSKYGSDLLKALLTMPDHTGFHAELEDGETSPTGQAPKGLAEWSLKSLAQYQAELARRVPIQREKGAAVWLAGHLGLDAVELEEAHTHAEAVIRTAMLVISLGGTEMPDWVGFEKMVLALRQQQPPEKSKKAASGKTPKNSASASGKTLSGLRTALQVLPGDLPPELAGVVSSLATTVAADLPRMLDSAVPVRALFANDSHEHHAPLLGRYFWLEDIASELAHHENAVAAAWDKATRGNHDDGSLLTLFVCLAAGLPARTQLTEKGAKDLVRRLQKPGGNRFDPEIAHEFIQDSAPAQYQDGYRELWTDFLEEALPALQSDSAFALQDALALLRRECNVAR